LRQVNRDVQRDDGFVAEPNLTVREALDRAAARIDGRFHDQPLVEAALRLTIAQAYRGVGQDNRATAHVERSVALRTAHLGAEHPDTLESVWTLAMNYQFVGRIADTIALLERIVEYRTRTFGPNHPSTLGALNALGEAYRKAGRLEQARQLLARLVEQRTAVPGPDPIALAHCMHDLGLVYRDMGRYEEAIALFESAIKRMESLGVGLHSNTLHGMWNLAGTYEKAGKLDEAATLLGELIRRKGKENARETERLTDLRLRLLLRQKKFAEAEPIARHCLAVRAQKRQQDWENAWPTLNAKLLLGSALLGQGKHVEADPLLREGSEGMNRLEARLPNGEREEWHALRGEIEELKRWAGSTSR
jgi:tetratricopeptide (TPR) repeat protein